MNSCQRDLDTFSKRARQTAIRLCSRRICEGLEPPSRPSHGRALSIERADLAGRSRFELKLAVLETTVLPLHHRPKTSFAHSHAARWSLQEPSSGVEPETYRLRNGRAPICARTANSRTTSQSTRRLVRAKGLEPLASAVAQPHSDRAELRPQKEPPAGNDPTTLCSQSTRSAD